MDTVSEIKARLSIEEVVSGYVQLKKIGRSYKGLCPFHKEKTPSFIVSPEKQLAYCFGCHKGGDLFSFIQEAEGLDFKEAVSFLSDKAGIQVVESASKTISKDQKEVLYEINQAAADFFKNKLWSDEGKEALDYCFRRKLKEETIREFCLGYAPGDFEASYRELLGRGFSIDDIIKSGVISSRVGNQGSYYDRFRHRLMFPIFNSRGRIVGFSGRVLDPKDEPKYLNSPDSPIYNKSEVLYGFFQAKDAIRDQGMAIIVEGNMDVISLYQRGIKNVTASCGTALTDKQLTFLKRYTTKINLAFDNDVAGHEAVFRVIPIAQKLELPLKIISLQNAKDPDELVANGAELFIEALSRASHYFDFFLERKIFQKEQGIISDKDVIRAVLDLIHNEKSPLDKDDYVRRLAARFLIKPEILYEEFKAMRKKRRFTSAEMRSDLSLSASDEKNLSTEEYFWGMILENPDFFGEIKEKITIDVFSQFYGECWLKLAQYFDQNLSFENDVFFSQLDETIQRRLKVLMMYAESRFPESPEEIKRAELMKIVDKLQTVYYDRLRRRLMQQMKQAKAEGNNPLLKELFQKYSGLLKEK